MFSVDAEGGVKDDLVGDEAADTSFGEENAGVGATEAGAEAPEVDSASSASSCEIAQSLSADAALPAVADRNEKAERLSAAVDASERVLAMTGAAGSSVETVERLAVCFWILSR